MKKSRNIIRHLQSILVNKNKMVGILQEDDHTIVFQIRPTTETQERSDSVFKLPSIPYIDLFE